MSAITISVLNELRLMRNPFYEEAFLFQMRKYGNCCMKKVIAAIMKNDVLNTYKKAKWLLLWNDCESTSSKKGCRDCENDSVLSD